MANYSLGLEKASKSCNERTSRPHPHIRNCHLICYLHTAPETIQKWQQFFSTHAFRNRHGDVKKCVYKLLVGGWTNPFEKYARQNEHHPQMGVKIKNVWNHHPDGHSKMNTLQYMESVHYFMIFSLLGLFILFFRWAPALLLHSFANSHNKAGSKKQLIKKNTVAI